MLALLRAAFTRGDAFLDVISGGRIAKTAKKNCPAIGHTDVDGAVTSHAQRQVQRALPLDAVVSEGAAVLQLLAREHEALPAGRNALLVMYLDLDVADSVAGLNLEGDGLAGGRLHEHLHFTAQAANQL